MERLEKWLIDRGVIWTWWCRGEPDDDLHGFMTVRERNDYENGEMGPFRRVVRDHHKFGPIPEEILAVRKIYFIQ